MNVGRLHSWNLKPAEARDLQRSLCKRVRSGRLQRRVRAVTGVDMGAISNGRATAAAVVMSFPELEVLEVQRARRKLSFPYVPGLLSFREGPVVAAALRKLKTNPGLILVDGHGLAHPRRFGIACHLGLLTDTPVVGCAKSRLCGEHDDVGPERGCHVPLEQEGEELGAVVRTRDNVQPLYVSVGHKISLTQAIEYVLACGSGFRLPEPTRLAHQAAAGTLRVEQSRRKG